MLCCGIIIIDTLIFFSLIFLIFILLSFIFPDSCTSKGFIVPSDCVIFHYLTIFLILLLSFPPLYFLIFFKFNKTLGEKVMGISRNKNDYGALKNLGLFYLNIVLLPVLILLLLNLQHLF